MKNILRVFKNDLNKIHNNVIAMIVIMGILVIPTLYAWFNIAASWDPYGSTDGLKIAVASEDAGYTSELINVDPVSYTHLKQQQEEEIEDDCIFYTAWGDRFQQTLSHTGNERHSIK